MAENIDKSIAEKTLLSAFRNRCAKNDEISKAVKKVLGGSHKTYKYVLVNAILAKASNSNIDPLALQAGAPLDGAYDARSLCHQVLVPFERDFLQNALGGSNEPFLNKPARFTHLSNENAVRKGRDKETLDLLITTLPKINSSKDAKEYLSCALEFLNKRIEELKVLNESEIKYNPTLVEIYEFIYRFIENSFEGETTAIVVGTLEKIYHSRQKGEFKVIAHKVNQSGASSKEVGDIDIIKNEQFQYAVEVKDKNFTAYDLEHAFSKIIESGGKKGEFVYGQNAAFDEDVIKAKLDSFESKGFMTLFMDIYSYSRFMLFKSDVLNKQEFIDCLMQTAIEINSKEAVRESIQNLLSELNWK
ncbi:restriction endonuclease, SacI family [Roseivirga sp.]|uniref:restriction endonuclease, SacI family n=1 Tax=Roseivirga sp. TaxID=1964215 RepID=UPI003B8C8E8B